MSAVHRLYRGVGGGLGGGLLDDSGGGGGGSLCSRGGLALDRTLLHLCPPLGPCPERHLLLAKPDRLRLRHLVRVRIRVRARARVRV